MHTAISLLPFASACFVTASSGAIFRPGRWYATLRKPSWTPPDWLFAPAWTVLYCMIAVSAWLVWRAAGSLDAALLPLAIFAANLVLNAAWSAFFFGLKRIDLALIDVTALWLSIVYLILEFYPFSQWAALLLVPYLLWVTFASVLNLAIWRLNTQKVRTFSAR